MVTRRTYASDEGFSLTEMLVVLSLMGIVLVGSYAALNLSNRAVEIARRNSYQSTAITQPMQNFDVVLSQNTMVENTASYPSNGYRLSCFTDQNNDGIRERHIISANTDGTLTETVYRVSAAGVNTTLVRTTVWQANTASEPRARNVNVLKGVPLFTYYSRDASGNATVAQPQAANEVLVQMEARYEDSDFNESRRIMFRNR